MVYGPLLYQNATLQHQHPVRKAAHQIQVVRNHEHRHATQALLLVQQIQNLSAQTHV